MMVRNDPPKYSQNNNIPIVVDTQQGHTTGKFFKKQIKPNEKLSKYYLMLLNFILNYANVFQMYKSLLQTFLKKRKLRIFYDYNRNTQYMLSCNTYSLNSLKVVYNYTKSMTSDFAYLISNRTVIKLSLTRGRPRKVNKDKDELVEDVKDVETGVESSKENKRGRSKKLKTAFEKEKPKKRGRPPISKK
ncbi:hypothetical protein BpHYR1_025610 [Brachionus plicatilis]|uniref:Uncharacterized protein n=1 Tax=Brachionus plicatilis TaxID=10195 RepID=A0A3M7SU48_BRAPC|nr:hypothetical protein BpHYR1_025610 [Brachionus plicatilis]